MVKTSSTPVFAVVGHPNKGKSSIVSTLARQDAISVSELSGTTTKSQAFHLTIEGAVHYTLVDTPGFQRPRQAHGWVEQHASHAAERKSAVTEFVNAFANVSKGEKFYDETQLLKPVLEGAGIIYVVDGSVPYSPEYEAEMALLQWTGQPRMALINPIGGEQYIEQWKNALGQFFNVVRVFDPMTADLEKQQTVLSAFAELQPSWRNGIQHTISALTQLVVELHQRGAKLALDSLLVMLQHQQVLPVPVQFAEAAITEQLKKSYFQALSDEESRMQACLFTLFAHHNLSLKMGHQTFEYPDLLDSGQWFAFGLSRKKIITLAASAGAAAGAIVDLGVGGASLMAGAVAGGLLSSAASFAATLKPDKWVISGVPLAGKTLNAGPVKDLNFSFVLLGRIIDFYANLITTTHAHRGEMTMNRVDLSQRLKALSTKDQLQLTRLLQAAHKGLSASELLKLQTYFVKLSAAH